nr:hypothetical protein [Tanacetum cinerariifolium]
MDIRLKIDLENQNKVYKVFPLPVIEFPLPEEVPTASEDSSHCQKKRDVTAVKIPLLLKLIRNCQSKSYDSFTKLVPHVTPCTTSDGTGKKKGRTVTVTADDMQKRKNDVKARATLLLSLRDEHQLRFSKYKTTQELCVAILKTFGGNEATKKTKKNIPKQQYGNFKAEGSKTLEQTFNRLQKKSETNSQNMAFISSAKHNRGNEEVNTASVSTASVNIGVTWKKISIQGTDVAGFLLSQRLNASTTIRWVTLQGSAGLPEARTEEGETTTDKENHALVTDKEASIKFALMAKTSAKSKVFDNSLCSKDWLAQVESRLAEHRDRELKYCEKIRGLEFKTESGDDYIESLKKELERIKKEKEGLDSKLTGFQTASKDLDSLLESQRLDKNKEGLGYSAVPPPLAQIYSPPKKDIPTNSKIDKAETAKKPPVKKVPTANRKFPTGGTKFSTTDMGKKGKAGSSQNNIDDKGYWDSGCSRHMTGNISYLFDYEPFDRGYVSFGQGGCKIIGKGTIKIGKLEFENVYFMKDLKFTWTFFLKTKDETSGILRKFITEIKDLQVKIIRCDNGGEFRNKEMNDFCSLKGIKREFSNARTPQQNGVAERRNRTLIEATRTMLADAKLPVTFWAEAVSTARKFKAKRDEGYFIGYSMSSKAFRVFNKRTRRVEENLHVEFLENKAIEKGAGPNWLFDIDSLTKSMNYVPVDAGINSTNLSGTKDEAGQEVKKDVSSLRYIDLPNWVHDALLESSSIDSDGVEADVSNMETTITASPTPTLRIHKDHPKKPKKIFDALQDPSWVKAMQEELFQFKIQNVWTLVDCPKGVRSIGTKWVLKNKKDERGIVIRNKARLVAQGHTHEEGIDYDEVFTLVARIEAIRLFLAYASFMGFTVYQMDVKNAFPYGTIDEEVELKALMHEKFQMSVMGELNLFLGLQVLQKEDGIFLSQDKYVGDILKKIGYSDVRSSNTPMDKKNPWGKDRTRKDVDLHLYRSTIGSLMYLTASRPDIMFAVCACARHQMTPKECHLHVVKRIFRYIKGHLKLGLWYPKESPFNLVAYSDSDYSGATQDCKSTTRGCQFLGRRLILWQCKKQTIVATSTTEAEYVAAAIMYRICTVIYNIKCLYC